MQLFDFFPFKYRIIFCIYLLCSKVEEVDHYSDIGAAYIYIPPFHWDTVSQMGCELWVAAVPRGLLEPQADLDDVIAAQICSFANGKLTACQFPAVTAGSP